MISFKIIFLRRSLVSKGELPRKPKGVQLYMWVMFDPYRELVLGHEIDPLRAQTQKLSHTPVEFFRSLKQVAVQEKQLPQPEGTSFCLFFMFPSKELSF